MADTHNDNGFREYKRLLLDTDKRHELRICELADKHERNHAEMLTALSTVAKEVAALRGEVRGEARTVGGIAGGLLGAVAAAVVAVAKVLWKL